MGSTDFVKKKLNKISEWESFGSLVSKTELEFWSNLGIGPKIQNSTPSNELCDIA